MKQHDVIIAGGGLNGPMLALALAQSGLSCAVIDAAPPRAREAAGFDGRAYAMALASQRLMAALGLWKGLAPLAQPILGVTAAQAREGEAASPLHLHFDSAEIEEGPVGYMVEDRHLSAALHEAMEEARIPLLPGCTVLDHAPEAAGVSVTTDRGDLSGRLLVGADGRRSPTAERAGIRRQGHDYGQVALVATIGHALPHKGVAHQLFLPGGPLAILPLKSNKCCLVWSLPAAEARAIAALPDADFLAVLAPRFGDFLGALTLEGGRFSYPLNLTLAEDYIADRLALIGDAAHGVHPIAGQGLNMGLRDVAVLAEVLVTAHRRGEDIGSAPVLERYQRWRRFDATTMALGMDSVNWLFSNESQLLRTARGLGMGLVQAIGPLRRHFMRQAAGLKLAGPMPRLLTGQRL